MARQTKAAFLWIINVLRKNKIPFYISGGFAAKVYGSPRPINDIDIDVPNKYFLTILELTKKYLKWGPKRWLKKPWNVTVFTLKYKEQEIDISNGETMKFYDLKKRKWVSGPSNFSRASKKRVFGIIVPIIQKKDLLYYKRLLKKYSSRKHQKIDIEALSS